MTRRVAILGGSFDPPHVGHLLAAVFVRAVRGVDEVWLVPSANHPFAKALTPFHHRVAMCEAMARDVGGWVKVSTVEADLGGEGRSIDLLEHLVAAYPEVAFSFVIGSDILGELPRWKAFDRIEALVEVIVLNRAGYPAARAIGPPMAEVSSTDLRGRLARGEPVAGLLPRSVETYIEREALYRPV